MSQTIVQQVLDYMTDKTTSMAVKISRQADEIKALNKEITRLMTELRDSQENLISSRRAEVGLAEEVMDAREEASSAKTRLRFAEQFIEEASSLILDVWDNAYKDGHYQVRDLAAFGRWRQTYRDLFMKRDDPEPAAKAS